jgi:hypothetical protein
MQLLFWGKNIYSRETVFGTIPRKAFRNCPENGVCITSFLLITAKSGFGQEGVNV